MKYKKYHIISFILLMCTLAIKEMMKLFYIINYNNNSLNIRYVYIINCFLLSLCFVLTIRGLLQRLRAALIINIVMITLFVIVNFLETAYFSFNLVLLGYILLSLIIQNEWFKAKSNPRKLKIGIILGCILILSNIIWLIILKNSFNDISMCINLCLLILVIRLVLEPQVFKSEYSFEDKQKVQALLRKYSTNPVSELILEDDKLYYFSNICEGVIGYTVINNIAIVAGEPICSYSDKNDMLLEFKKFCSNNSLSICFCQVSDEYTYLLKKNGFIVQEYGKEAVINLETYTLKGGKTANIRWANNKMEKIGIKVSEYKPLINRNEIIENQINKISNEWLKMKKGSELSFMLGTVSLDKPFDRRYFTASNSEGIILGFMVCVPYKCKEGYFIDITRRSEDAPLGIMEKLTVDICKSLKEENVKEVSLGLAPLADIQRCNNIESIIVHRFFKFIYNNMNSFYGFKALYHYKKKYNPSIWEPRFIAFSSEAWIISILYAMLKAKNPQGIRGVMVDRISELIKIK